MKERPILFSAPMVNAILAGRKTQTRRIVKKQPMNLGGDGPKNAIETIDGWAYQRVKNGCEYFYSGDEFGLCPYGVPGDRLWVRETHAICPLKGGEMGAIYRADGDEAEDNVKEGWEFMGKWTPSIFMRRKYSRITLEVTEVRVERLQDISELDAEAEGAKYFPDIPCREFPLSLSASPSTIAAACVHSYGMTTSESRPSPRYAFANLWKKINGDNSWNENPWVWVVSFKRITQ